MFTASILRALNKFNGTHTRNQVARRRARESTKKSTAASRNRENKGSKNGGSPSTRSETVVPQPKRIALSEPTEKCLVYAQAKCQEFTKYLTTYENATHPSAILRKKWCESQLKSWTARVNRLRKNMVAWKQYKIRYETAQEASRGLSTRSVGPEASAQNSSSTEDVGDFSRDTVHTNQCIHCGAKSSMHINTNKNTQQCTQCFREEICFDVVYTTGDRPMTSKQNHYYPENHWNNALNYAQGMRCGVVPPEIIRKVHEQLYHVYQVKREEQRHIHHELVRDILKDLKYKKRNKQRVLCWCIITGRRPVRLTISEYQEADKDFHIYFQHVRPVIAALNLSHRLGRKNLLSYDFLAYKIFERLSKTKPQYKRHMEWYKLLKGDDKLWVQDLIWSGVCDRANWVFYPTS